MLPVGERYLKLLEQMISARTQWWSDGLPLDAAVIN